LNLITLDGELWLLESLLKAFTSPTIKDLGLKVVGKVQLGLFSLLKQEQQRLDLLWSLRTLLHLKHLLGLVF
jgi:hypothetical protein